MSGPLTPSPKHHGEIFLLTLAAGGADALGYLGLGKVFTANMTGNIVLLGIALSEGRSEDTGRALLSLFVFVLGTCAAAWWCNHTVRKENWTPEVSLIFGVEATLLLAFAVFWALVPSDRLLSFAYPLIALLGLSMGLQGAAVYRLGIPGVVTTVITGTLTSLFTGLTKFASTKTEPTADKSPLLLQAIVVVTYGGGAATSGLLMLHARPLAGFFPITMVLIVILTRVIRRK